MLFQDENAMREAGFTGFRSVNEMWEFEILPPTVILLIGKLMIRFETVLNNAALR